MADRLRFSPLRLHYAYFILTSTFGSVIFYTARSNIQGLHFSDALFMCVSAMTGTGLNVVRPTRSICSWRLDTVADIEKKVDLSTLNPLQQGILFCLFILGHAFPIFATISLIRAWKLRSALKDNSDEEKEKPTVSIISTLHTEEKQLAYEKEISPSVQLEEKASITTVVGEVQSDALSPCEPERPWDNYGVVVLMDSRHPDQIQRVIPITSDDKKDVGHWRAHLSSLISRLKSMIQRAINHLSCRDSIKCNQPDEVECRTLYLTSVLILIYFIGFLILGIVSVGLWSKFVRPDIPRQDEVSPFWAGAFLATSAFCNNGMSLIDTNMGPYQRE